MRLRTLTCIYYADILAAFVALLGAGTLNLRTGFSPLYLPHSVYYVSTDDRRPLDRIGQSPVGLKKRLYT